MRLFYVISLLIVAALAACPFYLLPDDKAGELSRVIVSYSPEGEPVYKTDPVCNYRIYPAAVRSVDPTTCGDVTSSSIIGNIFDGLYTYAYLKTVGDCPAIEPDLTEDFPEISDDLLTYTIRLKKGVKYHRNPCFGKFPNGTCKTREVTADDFVLAFKRCADYHNVNTSTSWAFLAGRIEGLDEFREKTRTYKAGDFSRFDLDVPGIKALDRYTLRIKLIQPYPQLQMVLAMDSYAPCPREAVDYWLAGVGNPAGEIPLDQRSVEFREAEQTVGTDAYVLRTFDRKHKIVLVRNPDFRDEYYPSEGTEQQRREGLLDDAGKKLPFNDIIIFDFVPEQYSAWNLFLSGQTDASGIPPETYDFIITPGKDLTDEWETRHIYLRKTWDPAVFWIAFNMEDKVLGASKSLREAICLCYDVENHIKVLFNGRGRRAESIVPQTFPGFTPGEYYRYDVELAKRKIELAKKELAAKGLLDKDGQIPPLRLDLSDGTLNKRFAEFAATQFHKVGLRFTPVFNDWPTLQQKVHTKQAQMYFMGWHSDYYDAENFLQLFYSPNIKKGVNNSNYSNPQFDKLYEQISVMPDTPQRTAIYKKMITMVCDDCPVLPLSEPLTMMLIRDWYKNVKLHPIGYGYSKYYRIDPQQRKKEGGR